MVSEAELDALKEDLGLGEQYEALSTGEGEWSTDTLGMPKLKTYGFVRSYNTGREGHDSNGGCFLSKRHDDFTHKYCRDNENAPLTSGRGGFKGCGGYAKRSYCIKANSANNYLNASKTEVGVACPFLSDDKVTWAGQADNQSLVAPRISKCEYNIEVQMDSSGKRVAPLLVKLASGIGEDGDINPGAGKASSGTSRSLGTRDLWTQLAFGHQGLASANSDYKGGIGLCSDPSMADVIINREGDKTCADYVTDPEKWENWCQAGDNKTDEDCACVNIYREQGEFCLKDENKTLPGCNDLTTAMEELGIDSTVISKNAICLVGDACKTARYKPGNYEPCTLDNLTLCSQVNNLENVQSSGAVEVQSKCDAQVVDVPGQGNLPAGVPTPPAPTIIPAGEEDPITEVTEEAEEGEKDNTMLYIGIAAAIVFLLLIMLVAMR